ncbi:SIP1 domain-containing protein, partial [Erwinia amylovora]|uniref:SIP1 domain-containing protein n=1 Tax=Erwinia amylovora TaxID=552 RepID=UPI0020BFD95C
MKGTEELPKEDDDAEEDGMPSDEWRETFVERFSNMREVSVSHIDDRCLFQSNRSDVTSHLLLTSYLRLLVEWWIADSLLLSST